MRLPHLFSQPLPAPTISGLPNPDHWCQITDFAYHYHCYPLNLSRTLFSSGQPLTTLLRSSPLPDPSGPSETRPHRLIFPASLLGTWTGRASDLFGVPLHCFYECPLHIYTDLPCSIWFNLTAALGSGYSPIFRQGHWGSVTSNNLPKAPWLGKGRTRIQTRHSETESPHS